MLQWTIGFALDHNLLIYFLIIILACAEGPILSVVFGVLLRLGYLHFIPIYACLMLGDLIGDGIWYRIGRVYGHGFIARWGKYFDVTEEKVGKMTRLFHKYKHAVLFISKISNGFGFSLVTLMTAGVVRIPFGEYLSVNLLGQFVWTGILLAVGYFFSSAYIQVNNWAGRISLIVGIVLVCFALFRYVQYLRKRAEEIEI